LRILRRFLNTAASSKTIEAGPPSGWPGAPTYRCHAYRCHASTCRCCARSVSPTWPPCLARRPLRYRYDWPGWGPIRWVKIGA